MVDEIELVSDGDGLAVIGDPAAIERFLVGEGLESQKLDLSRLLPSAAATGSLVEAAGLVAAQSGRWVQITEKSARLMDKYNLMTGSAPGLGRAVLTGDNGKITGLVEIVQGGASIVTNPALLAGVGGLMGQLAMQQAMQEIHDYLQEIGEKVDDILRAQKDAVLADMVGVAFVIEEAMTLREQVGRVSDTTWSKVQSTTLTIAKTQAYALRQLDALAEKLERASGADAVAKVVKGAPRTVQEWLTVLARCYQLQDAVAVIELDRVLDASPDEVDRHRVGLKTARQNRLELISRSTMRLLQRMDAAADLSASEVAFNPFNARTVVDSTNDAGAAVVEFHAVIGVAGDRKALEAKRWVHAVEETRDQVLGAGAEGVEAVVRVGGEVADRARVATGRLMGDLSNRLLRPRERDTES